MIRIAIAEDDFRVASIHEKFLSIVDDVKIVGKAINGKELLILLESNDVDLLLLDVYMPDQLGTDLLYKIRSEFPNLDVIMITAATDKNLVEKALRNGVLDYIIKPLKLERFIETIENYKRKQKLLEEIDDLDQGTIDLFLRNHVSPLVSNEHLPKGIDPLTLQKVRGIVEGTQAGISAEEMGERMGASRTTARRYLEYLTSIKEAKAELEYGIVGRPERKYYRLTS